MKISRYLSFAGIICAVIFFIQGASNGFVWLFGFFLLLAFACLSEEKFRGYALTFFILSSVVISMYHPQFFTNMGGYELKKLIVPILMIIMFGMGASMKISDVVGIVKMPKAILIGIICQLLSCPL